MTKINDNWLFTDDYTKGFEKAEEVRIPHNPSLLPLHYSSPDYYEMVSGYKKTIVLEEEDLDKRIFLLFEGVAHIATLYFNGKEIGTHYSGYTSFTYEVTEFIKKGENEIVLKVDGRESCNTPPFGFVIDYLTYSGIYRDVFLIKKNKSYIKDVFVSSPTLSSLRVEYDIESESEYSIRYSVFDNDRVIIEGETKESSLSLSSLSVSPWSPSSPKLYTLLSSLLIKGEVIDENTTEFGFRTVETKGKDLYINGEKVFLKGLNRHQAWPYIGYAAPERMQRMDARILKEELGCDIVRTSHYPQSRHFISECDRLGLLVFTEIPGWQHIGDKEWKEKAIINTKEMVLQYRNHPSVIIWGVRINESQDDDEFYKKTNETAHALDPTRPTSGVRYIENSSLLEDIYSYNDFSHTGNNSGVKEKGKITKHQDKPLLVSEANGHMFPTKSFDTWERRQEHALRHARVINDAKKDGDHIGAIEWCMTDYATHKDFGSGDRICYHGVMDSFRNPKDAAYFWATNQEKNEVLHISSSMDIGDYNGGIRGKIWVFTNAERVDVYKNGRKITSLSPSPFSSLDHGPLVFDDTIGNLLETDEGFDKKKADRIKECLNAAVEYGFQNLPKKYLLKLAYIMLRYKLNFNDGVKLFNKYVSGWGGEGEEWKFQGIWNGKEGKSVTLAHSSKLHLDIIKDTSVLYEGNGYDETLVRIRVLDEFNNPAPYAQLPISIKTSGSIENAGYSLLTLEGGMGGVIIKTNGGIGKGVLSLSSELGQMDVEFEVRKYDK